MARLRAGAVRAALVVAMSGALGGLGGLGFAEDTAPIALTLPPPWRVDQAQARVVGAHVLGDSQFAGIPLDLNASRVEVYVQDAPRVIAIVGRLSSAQPPVAAGLDEATVARAAFTWLRAGLEASRHAGEATTIEVDREGAEEPGARTLVLAWTNRTTGIHANVAAMLALGRAGLGLAYVECYFAFEEGVPDGAARRACDQAISSLSLHIPRAERLPLAMAPAPAGDAISGTPGIPALRGDAGGTDAAALQLAVPPRRMARAPFYLIGGLLLLGGVVWYIVGVVRAVRKGKPS